LNARRQDVHDRIKSVRTHAGLLDPETKPEFRCSDIVIAHESALRHSTVTFSRREEECRVNQPIMETSAVHCTRADVA
jgi:hypothetical protein